MKVKELIEQLNKLPDNQKDFDVLLLVEDVGRFKETVFVDTYRVNSVRIENGKRAKGEPNAIVL